MTGNDQTNPYATAFVRDLVDRLNTPESRELARKSAEIKQEMERERDERRREAIELARRGSIIGLVIDQERGQIRTIRERDPRD